MMRFFFSIGKYEVDVFTMYKNGESPVSLMGKGRCLGKFGTTKEDEEIITGEGDLFLPPAKRVIGCVSVATAPGLT